MNPTGLFAALSAIHPLSDGFRRSLLKELIPLSFPKNYLLIETPKVAEHVYFIEKGFAMSYTFEEGKKYVDAFWKAGQIVTATNSFFEQVPSTENIILMHESDLLCISRSSLLRLFDLHKETHVLYHKIMNRNLAKCRARIYDFQRLSAAERFDNLIRLYPNIEQIVSQENIASFLSITPQSLSRLKRHRDAS